MAQGGRLVRSALQRALAAPARLHQHQYHYYQQQQKRSFHASGIALARKSKRSGPVSPSSVTKTQAVFGEDEVDEDDEKEIEEWFNRMQKDSKKSARFGANEKNRMGALEEDDDNDDDDDDDLNDKEAEEFLSEVDELFTLEPEEFERKMQTYDKRQANKGRSATGFDDDEDEDDDDDGNDDSFDGAEAEDEIEIDRATERISKKKLLKVLDDLQPGASRSGKNAESMALPKTKNSAPLEKKPKKVNADRISYRQERIELSVVDFVQTLLLQDSDSSATDVVANIVEASVAPDLRRVVLFWEPQRQNSENQTISKRKVAGIERRLQSQERWIRAQVTRHLNLKYSPNVQFKQRKNAKSDENRAVFDREMEWLNRF